MRTRLNEILSMIGEQYDEIWDTCCDHGKLGISILERNLANRVHFVDCIPSIMLTLEAKLLKSITTCRSKYKIHTLMAEDIVLPNNKSLICICGVGGITAINIIKGLLLSNDLLNKDILLCVQYKIPKLRRFLKEAGFKLQDEKLCFEGKWAHEILKVSREGGSEIDLVGSSMYDLKNNKHLTHLNNSIEHYTKKAAVSEEYRDILDTYLMLQDSCTFK